MNITLSENTVGLLTRQAERINLRKAEGAPDTTAQEIAMGLISKAALSYENTAEKLDGDDLLRRFSSADPAHKPAIRAALVAALEHAGV